MIRIFLGKHRTFFAAALLAGVAVPAHATWYYAYNGTPQTFPQEGNCWCGPAIEQGWIYDLTGLYYTQSSLASAWSCIVGANAGKLRDKLNQYAGGASRTFFYMNILDSAGQSRNAELLLMMKIKEGKRVAIAGNTVNASGVVTTFGGHWLLVYAVDIVQSGGVDVINAVKMRDPLWNSVYAPNYSVIPINTAVSKSELFSKRWSPITTGGERQFVSY